VEHPVKARTTKEQKSGITICLEIMVIKYENAPRQNNIMKKAARKKEPHRLL
jgi:hypothetical protein